MIKSLIPSQTYRRLPQYYTYIKALWKSGAEQVSSPAVAQALRLNEVQVRKDLAAVSREGGRPRTGFSVAELYESIREHLGYDNVSDVILVGAGQLGRALLNYTGFEESGLHIVAAFDVNENIVGTTINGKQVFHLREMQRIAPRLQAQIGILAASASEAQAACDALLRSGIRAIWNFAPVHLNVPQPILVQNENIAASLAALSRRLEAALKGGGEAGKGTGGTE